jgi:hypothetical protein
MVYQIIRGSASIELKLNSTQKEGNESTKDRNGQFQFLNLPNKKYSEKWGPKVPN